MSGGWGTGEFAPGNPFILFSTDSPDWLLCSLNLPACSHLIAVPQLCPELYLEDRTSSWSSCLSFVRKAPSHQVSSIFSVPMPKSPQPHNPAFSTHSTEIINTLPFVCLPMFSISPPSLECRFHFFRDFVYSPQGCPLAHRTMPHLVNAQDVLLELMDE